jgi:hypothetical protein
MRNKNAAVAVGLALFAVLMLAATNPRRDQFDIWLEIQGIRSPSRSGEEAAQGGAFGSIESAAGLPAADSGFRRTDCFVFSLYDSRRADGSADRSYIGLARSFIRLR